MESKDRARKYTVELHEQIVANVRKGQPKSLAYKVVRVNPQTVWDWIAIGKERPDEFPEYVKLAEDIEHAQAESVAERLARIDAAAKEAPRHWTADAWILERTMPEHFARRDRVEVEASKPLQQINQVVLIDQNAREAAFELLDQIAGRTRAMTEDAEVLELEAHVENES